MVQGNYSVVFKGEYDNGKNLCVVYPKQYIFLKNNKRERFLSLRFFNGLDYTVTYVEFILFELDIAGNVIKKFRVREDGVHGATGKTFSLPSGIKLSPKCADFKVQMVEARCGKYSYSLKHKGAAPVYLTSNKWKYDPDYQGYNSEYKVKSRMQKNYKLVNILAASALLVTVLVSLFPLIKFLVQRFL